MSLNRLINRLTSTDYFIERYNDLLLHSVRTQFPSLVYKNEGKQIDWNYLITCASLFAQSKDGKILDMAYRICQTCMTQKDLKIEYHNACAAIFEVLTNSPAISLSKRRAYISDDYLANLPIQCVLDVKRKQFSNTISDGDNFIFLNDFQKEVYDSFDNTKLLSISAPTSAGKSFILLQMIKEFICNNSLVKIAYIVPTRALIQQVEMDIREIAKKCNLVADVSSIPVKPDTWNTTACVMIFTQERLQWIISESADITFDFVIVDEAQKIGDGSRGILLQQVLQQIAVNDVTRFIFASPMSENPSSLLKIINYSDEISPQSKQVISEIATVNQNLIWVYKDGTGTEKWQMDLLSKGERINLGYINTDRITKTSMRLPVLAFTLSGSKKGNLIYCNGAAEAEKTAIQLMSLILDKTPDLAVSIRVKELIKLVKKTIHPNYALVEVLKAGVAFHYGNMPLIIRNEIETLFKNGDISFLVCTSTLVEGVNLPAKSIYIRGPQKGKNNPMSEMDFWNLAGRAGRQGKEFQGNIICLDAIDESVWKNGTPLERKKYRIKGTVESVVETKSQELINYIGAKNETVNKDTQLDYAYTYFLSAFFQYEAISKSPFTKLYSKEFCQSIDDAFQSALLNVEIPSSLLAKNQGVNPLAQQKLLDYFRNSNKSAEELIPPYPENDDAQERYMHIIGRISKYITGDSYKLNMSRSILITGWMRGYGLARIISDNIRWNQKQNSNKKLATIIRDTMREIEEFARFRFLKYTTCYLDVLKYYFVSTDNVEAIKKIPEISLWLEFGASKTTQISLMSMGFTRTAALELSELMVSDDYDKAKCMNWFSKNEVHSMDISPTILQEVDKILSLQ